MIDRPSSSSQELIRFDTTNPPGNEEACIAHVEALLATHGHRVASATTSDPARPNLVARHAGASGGAAAPAAGHVDVVTTAGQRLDAPAVRRRARRRLHLGPRRARHEGRRRDDASPRSSRSARGRARRRRRSLVRARRRGERRRLRREVPRRGASGTVRRRAHALGEFGGVALDRGGKRFYPIQVAEKQICWLTRDVRGPRRPRRDAAARRDDGALGSAARPRPRTAAGSLHACRPAMLEAMASAAPGRRAPSSRALLGPAVDRPRSCARSGRAGSPRAVLRNTVSATIVARGDKHNVVPARSSLRWTAARCLGSGPTS